MNQIARCDRSCDPTQLNWKYGEMFGCRETLSLARGFGAGLGAGRSETLSLARGFGAGRSETLSLAKGFGVGCNETLSARALGAACRSSTSSSHRRHLLRLYRYI